MHFPHMNGKEKQKNKTKRDHGEMKGNALFLK